VSEVSLPDQSPPAPQPTLSDSELSNLGRLLGFPLQLPPEFVTWLQGQIQVLMSAGNIQGLQQRIAVVGDLKLICKDLTGTPTALTPYEDAQGTWLYCNGASFTAAVYPKLNAFLGGLVLPDAQGRALFACGTNAATNLLDNDAVALASRQPKHTHSDTLGVSGGGAHTHGAGTLVTDTAAAHTHSLGSAGGFTVTPATGAQAVADSTGSTSGSGGSHSHAISGSTASGGSSPSISGSVGTGMAGSDAVAHCVVGSLLIKAD
jgi:hypothetical protein